MLEVRPFRALRYNEAQAGPVDSLCCPPYDIISAAERAAYLERNPHNVIRLELPQGTDAYGQAGRTLESWLEEGVLRCDGQPGIYIYEEEFTAHGATRRVRGFIARVRLEEFEKGIILPHEETLSKAKEDRFNLMRATGCNFSQIYSLYCDGDRAVSGLVSEASAGEPAQAFTDADGVTHRLWISRDETVHARLAQRMADKRAYIADGHHRYETALRYREHLRAAGALRGPEDPANYVMMMLVNMENEGLVVFPTHRVVRGLEGFDAAGALRRCEPYFAVSEGAGDPEEALVRAYAAGEASFILYRGQGAWSRMTLRDRGVMRELLPDASEACRMLDVTVLHTLVLERLFGIDRENMAGQKNLTYTRDADEARALVDTGDASCAFLLNPTRVEEIAAVAAAGEKMPQKSTYFYPKLITGLVMNRLHQPNGNGGSTWN